MARIIIDTNVIISASFGGIPLEAVDCANDHTIYISDKIEKELFGVVEKLIHKLSPHQIAEIRIQMNNIIRNAKKLKSGKSIKICRDPKDNAYLGLAKAANADVLITGDKDLLSLSAEDLRKIGLSRLKIITPRKFIIEYSSPYA